MAEIFNPYEVINSWLKENYTPLNDWIYFNCIPASPAAVALNSVPGDAYERKFITGAVEKSVIFSIDMVQNYDPSGTSYTNLEAMNEVLQMTEWLKLQNKDMNFPPFGEGFEISMMEILTNVPSLLIDTTSGLAKYQFQGRIVYIDRREEII